MKIERNLCPWLGLNIRPLLVLSQLLLKFVLCLTLFLPSWYMWTTLSTLFLIVTNIVIYVNVYIHVNVNCKTYLEFLSTSDIFFGKKGEKRPQKICHIHIGSRVISSQLVTTETKSIAFFVLQMITASLVSKDAHFSTVIYQNLGDILPLPWLRGTFMLQVC